MTEILLWLLALLGGLAGFNHVRANRASRRAADAEARARAAEQQADQLARMEIARNLARQAGEDELAKMRDALKAGRRDQLEKP